MTNSSKVGPRPACCEYLFGNFGPTTDADPVLCCPNPDNPAGRTVPLRHLGDDLQLLGNGKLVTTIFSWRTDLERTGRAQLGDRLIGDATSAFGLDGALTNTRAQRPDLFQNHLDRIRRFGFNGYHLKSPTFLS